METTKKQKRLTIEKCEELYIEHKTPPWVILHCKQVALVARTIGEQLNNNGLNLDTDLIYSAGLIHDLLRVREDHGNECAILLIELGYYEEAEIVKEHMRYTFNPFDKINEADLMCLGDRLVIEDEYVGLEKRIDYVLNLTKDKIHLERILQSKIKSQELMNKIEERIGIKIDDLF